MSETNPLTMTLNVSKGAIWLVGGLHYVLFFFIYNLHMYWEPLWLNRL